MVPDGLVSIPIFREEPPALLWEVASPGHHGERLGRWWAHVPGLAHGHISTSGYSVWFSGERVSKGAQ